MRYQFLLSLAILLGGCSIAMASESDDPALEGFGDGLLDRDLLEELMKDPPPVDRPAANPNIEGEDIGGEESPLEKIERGMQSAGNLIRSQDITGETKDVQQGVITELDKLIDKLNKQCQKCSVGQCDNSGQQQTKKQTPKPGGSSGGQASSAAQASTESQGVETKQPEGNDHQPQQATGSQLVKQLWGQLPERMRQQLLQSSADEFLPKYRKQLEQYYRRLAEEQSATPSP